MNDTMPTETEQRVRDVLAFAARTANAPDGLADRIVAAGRLGDSGGRTPTPSVLGRLTSRRFLTSMTAAVVVAGLALGATRIPWSTESRSSSSAPTSADTAASASGTTANSAGPMTNGVARGADSEATRKAAAQDFAATLMSRVTLPAGAVSLPSSPAPSLDEDSTSRGTTNVAEQHGWWTVTGTMAATLAALRAHPPSGLSLASTSGSQDFQVLSYDAPSPALGVVGGAIDLAVTAYRDGSAIRVDAQAFWIPLRSTAESIPAGITSVEVVITRVGSSSTSVRRTLSGAAVLPLAAIINGLSTSLPGDHSCPGPNRTYVLTFGVPGRTATTVSGGFCGWVYVKADKVDQPRLEDDGKLYPALLKALGLPSNY